jgi:hypothetical protein
MHTTSYYRLVLRSIQLIWTVGCLYTSLFLIVVYPSIWHRKGALYRSTHTWKHRQMNEFADCLPINICYRFNTFTVYTSNKNNFTVHVSLDQRDLLFFLLIVPILNIFNIQVMCQWLRKLKWCLIDHGLEQTFDKALFSFRGLEPIQMECDGLGLFASMGFNPSGIIDISRNLW